MNSPIVSVGILTHNHDKYISQAIDSVLEQVANFPIEIIIHDDESTDLTASIIRKYENKYPDRFKTIIQRENQYPRIKRLLAKYVFPICSGKYIALCEGDDYWTDPHKLQKQVGYMEEHPEYAMCFHNRIKVDEAGNPIPRSELPEGMKRPLTKEEIAMSIYPVPPTATVMYRKNCLPSSLPSWALRMPFGDRAMAILVTRKGDAGYLDFIGSAYRIHPGGVLRGGHRSRQALMDFQSRCLVLNNVPMSKSARDFVAERSVRSCIRAWNATAGLPAARSLSVYYRLIKLCLGCPRVIPGLAREVGRDWRHFLIVTLKALFPPGMIRGLRSGFSRGPAPGKRGA